jgi:hypothetical protein
MTDPKKRHHLELGQIESLGFLREGRCDFWDCSDDGFICPFSASTPLISRLETCPRLQWEEVCKI